MERVSPGKARESVVKRIGPGMRAYAVAWFLGALVFLFVTMPFLEHLSSGAWVETALFTLVLMSAVVAVGGTRRWLVGAVVIAAPTVAVRWVEHAAPGVIPPEVFQTGALAFSAFVAARLMVFVIRAPRVNAEVVCAGLATYLMIALVFAFMYMIVEQASPGSFACTLGDAPQNKMVGFNFLYYSLVSMNGAAFGDFLPAKPTARMLGMMQTTVGLFYMAVMVARLVSLYAPSGAPSAKD